MKIAIPMAQGTLSRHFGHCEEFALVEVDEAQKKITGQTRVTPPPHEPGVLPRWLHEQGAQVIIAGGMGQRAQDLLAQSSIRVIVGVESESVEELVALFLSGRLRTGANLCDH
ncbi:MAG: NifB/NifX family molybdenum-iron cluster-binding protein [candidate division FCPU426 bacterium]